MYHEFVGEFVQESIRHRSSSRLAIWRPPTIMNDQLLEAEADSLRLDQFLKANGIAATGGQAKYIIQNGEVKLNGEIETRRRRKLAVGDVIEVAGKQYPVTASTS